jgi:DNA-binding response OmpR family regulator
LENNKKVLVIDDEAHIRRVVEVKLKKHGYDVCMASDGEQGLEMIKRDLPDVVITDIMMPKIDGKTLCEMTNGFKKQRPFLTIVTTCRISNDEEKWVKHFQDTMFMEKPFSPAKLIEYVDNYCRRQP